MHSSAPSLKKLVYLIVGSAFMALLVFNGDSVRADGVDGPFIAEAAQQNAMDYSAQQALIACTYQAETVTNSKPSRDNILAGKSWWMRRGNDFAKVGYFDNQTNGMLECVDSSGGALGGKISGVIGRFGWQNLLSAYCDLNKNNQVAGKTCGTDDASMPTKFLTRNDAANVRSVLASKNGGKLRTLSDSGRYVSNWQALKYACGVGGGIEVQPNNTGVDLNGNPVTTTNTVLLTIVNNDGTTSQVRFKINKEPPEYIEAFSAGENGDGIGFRDCQAVANDMNAFAGKYQSFVRANPDTPAASPLEDEKTPEATPVCTGGGLGWILCPLTTLVTDSISAITEYMETFMRFEPLIGSEQGTAIQSIWGIVVGIANICLIIAFLIVIFSQATSIGLSAYGIKKMLPRIIAAAILINISYFICALMIDIANIVGASIQGIINSAAAQIGTNSGVDFAPSFGESVGVLIGVVGGVGAIAALGGAIGFVVPILIGGAVSLFSIFIVLALRHVITILLVIISPLAFAAMILPNTDGLFKAWWKAFYISLALYPIIMLLAYGSTLASRIILVAAPTDGSRWIWEIFAFIILFAWIWALKTIVTLGGGLVGKLAGVVNDRSKGIIDRPRNWAKQKQQNSTFGTIMNTRKNAVNTNAQRRSYDRMGKRGWGTVSSAGMMGETKQLMDTQIDEANTKIHAQRVAYAAAEVRKQYNASSPADRVKIADAARTAAMRGDQVKLDALMSHAATTGPDEFSDVYNQLQTGLRAAGGSDALKDGGKYHDILSKSNAHTFSAHGADLGQKNRGLASMLQTTNPDSDINDTMRKDSGIQTYYTRMSAEKIASFSSDTAKSAAQFLDDSTLDKLVYDPNVSKGVGTSAAKAYADEIALRAAGTHTQSSIYDPGVVGSGWQARPYA